MSKTSLKLIEYRYKQYPPYPKTLSTTPDLATITIKAFLNTTWSDSQHITNQIVAAVKQGAHANGNKTTNPVAMTSWRNLLQPHVYGVLLTGGNWAASSANVLTAARSMGDIAATLTNNSNECKANQLKAAYKAAKLNTTCGDGTSGGGNWCTFEWI